MSEFVFMFSFMTQSINVKHVLIVVYYDIFSLARYVCSSL